MSSQKVATGILGLDKMLGGGFPEGRVILVVGGPGTGKTVFCSQFLHWGTTNRKEGSVYISLDENEPQFSRETLCFGWDFRQLENEGRFVFVDASGVRRTPEQAKVGRIPVGGKELGLVNLLDMIQTSVEKTKAHRVVLDSISGLAFRFPGIVEKRLAVLDIFDGLSNTGATCLVTSEVRLKGQTRLVQPEEYLAHGVIDLQTLRNGIRQIQVVKMRETRIDTTPRPYTITETGIEIAADEFVYASEREA